MDGREPVTEASSELMGKSLLSGGLAKLSEADRSGSPRAGPITPETGAGILPICRLPDGLRPLLSQFRNPTGRTPSPVNSDESQFVPQANTPVKRKEVQDSPYIRRVPDYWSCVRGVVSSAMVNSWLFLGVMSEVAARLPEGASAQKSFYWRITAPARRQAVPAGLEDGQPVAGRRVAELTSVAGAPGSRSAARCSCPASRRRPPADRRERGKPPFGRGVAARMATGRDPAGGGARQPRAGPAARRERAPGARSEAGTKRRRRPSFDLRRPRERDPSQSVRFGARGPAVGIQPAGLGEWLAGPDFRN